MATLPPQRVTRALGNEFDQRTTSSRSMRAMAPAMAGLETRIARINSLIRLNSRFSSLIVRFWSLISVFSSASFCCWLWHSVRSSRTQLWSLYSSLGMMKPQPFSQGNGLLGLNSHSSRWDCKASSFSTAGQPYNWLSQVMLRRLRRFRKMREERRFDVVMGCLSTGQVGWRLSHSWMQPVQKACSHVITWSGSSRTDEHIGQMSSSSTSPEEDFFYQNDLDSGFMERCCSSSRKKSFLAENLPWNLPISNPIAVLGLFLVKNHQK